jgi:hypothetical protein
MYGNTLFHYLVIFGESQSFTILDIEKNLMAKENDEDTFLIKNKRGVIPILFGLPNIARLFLIKNVSSSFSLAIRFFSMVNHHKVKIKKPLKGSILYHGTESY